MLSYRSPFPPITSTNVLSGNRNADQASSRRDDVLRPEIRRVWEEELWGVAATTPGRVRAGPVHH